MAEKVNRDDPLLEEAIDWLLRLHEASYDPDVAKAFDAWVSQSEAHVRAWSHAQHTWQILGEVQPVYSEFRRGIPEARDGLRSDTVPVGLKRISASRQTSFWKSRRAGMMVALAACITIMLAAPSALLYLHADYLTDTGQTQSVVLDDGSVVHLGADSAITADVERDIRRVSLLTGEAYFDIAPDPQRPFVVDAGSADIVALGTAFNVRLSNTTATVELANGAIDFFAENNPRGNRLRLAPGETAALDTKSGEIARNEIALENIGAWRSGFLFVQDTPIASIVEQLQRYHYAWIGVPDAKLAARRVTGLFELSDPDRALRALVQPYGGKVRTLSPFLKILSRI